MMMVVVVVISVIAVIADARCVVRVSDQFGDLSMLSA